MSLIPGTRRGIYEITAQIGEGGMGRVYRARDTKLGRNVAIKVIADSLPYRDHVARFDGSRGERWYPPPARSR